MENKKVYVLTTDDTFDHDQTLTIKLFDTLEKAQQEMETQIKNFENNTDTEYNVNEKESNYYSVYDENNYNEDHFEILIQEKEIK